MAHTCCCTGRPCFYCSTAGDKGRGYEGSPLLPVDEFNELFADDKE